MKTLCAIVAILFVSAAVTPRANAQVTITATDVSSQFAVGNYTINNFDSVTTSLNIGKKGHSSWDFSGLKKSFSMTLTSIAVSSGLNYGSFPGATHAFQTSTFSYNYNGTVFSNVTGYLFFKLSGNLLNLGESATIPGGGASLIQLINPADVFYSLPSTYGTTWTSTHFDTTTIFLGIYPIGGLSAHHKASYVVDAWGPLTIPGGTVHDVLRIKKTDTTSTYTSVGYIFIAKDGTLIQVSGANVTAPDSGTIAVNSGTSWAAPINTAVEAEAQAPARFALAQNYPNPFNPSTAITYSLPARSFVHLAVYNVLGQMVAELVNTEQEAGSHNVEWRPTGASGIYFCRMDAVSTDKTAARFSDVKKMAYVR
ncbi:MAG TPA: T9SS type A sorting domain-containing protein [Bacteroidota bacterium]|nr:T9SS type A sorting domain-containing protein [Bacteroidota bacterium]